MHTTSGLRFCNKIHHLAGRGRERDGLHEASAAGQQLRQHHGGDLIRLVASGQAEDARPRADPVALLDDLFRRYFLLALGPFVNHLLQALQDEVCRPSSNSPWCQSVSAKAKAGMSRVS